MPPKRTAGLRSSTRGRAQVEPLPGAPTLVLIVLVTAVAVEAAHALITGTPAPFFDDWLHDAVLLAAAAVCGIGARRHTHERRGWTYIAGAVLCIGLSDVLWSLLYSNAATIPYPNYTDIFSLVSYPLFMTGLILIVRHRVSRFDLDRWLDGLVILLIVAIPTVALVLEPALRRARTDLLGQIVTASYPLGDLLLLGALLGAVPLMSWRVDASWGWLGLGLLCLTVGDAVYAAAAVDAVYHASIYDFLWTAGCVAIAIAVWRPATESMPGLEPVGWSAIILPLGAQIFAVATQIYGYFAPLPRTERILTIAVLGIGIAQVIAGRPRTRPTSVERAGPPCEHDK